MIHDTLVRGHEYTVLSLPPISAWALLFAGKDVESRSFSTTHRGRVLIHASSERLSLRENQARRAELSFLSGLPPSALPTIFARGAILGTVELVDCAREVRSKWAVPGKYHWMLGDARPLSAPIEGVEGESLLFRWTYQAPVASARRSRVPLRSGVVPAVRLRAEEPSAPPSAQRRRRG